MMEQTAVRQGQAMTSFRSNLRQLMLDRSAEIGRALTQTEIATAAGVSFATVQRLYDDKATFKRIDADTIYGLRDYFGCGFDDLFARAEDEAGPP